MRITSSIRIAHGRTFAIIRKRREISILGCGIIINDFNGLDGTRGLRDVLGRRAKTGPVLIRGRRGVCHIVLRAFGACGRTHTGVGSVLRRFPST